MGSDTPDIRVLLGLGNPGSRYRTTRHNLGYRVVDLLAARWDLRLKRKTAARVALRRRRGGPVVLAKPVGYMNESGAAAGYLSETWGIPPAAFLVLLDDATIPLGRLRVRRGGSDGGHRGLRSVLEVLGTDRVPRLRLGVGREGDDLADYVLDRFEPEERQAAERLVADAADCVEMVLREGLEPAMNEFNRREPLPAPR